MTEKLFKMLSNLQQGFQMVQLVKNMLGKNNHNCKRKRTESKHILDTSREKIIDSRKKTKLEIKQNSLLIKPYQTAYFLWPVQDSTT